MTTTTKEIIERIELFRTTCNYRGWNSYDAQPVNEESIKLALSLVPLLKPLLDTGDWWVTPGPRNGDVNFETHGGRNQISVWRDEEE